MGITRLKLKKEKKPKNNATQLSTELNGSDDGAVSLDEYESPLNGVYLTVSRIFHIAEYVFFAATLLFIVTFVVANPKTISYRNFLAIVNEINAAQPEYERYVKLNYSTETPEKSVVFGSGIAVLSDDNVFMFSGTGRFIYSQLHGINDPYICAKGKYAVVYGFGTNEYKIYSSYSQIYSGTTEYPIYSCSVSADGSVAFVEYLPNGKTRVCAYNSAFEEIGYIDISGYAVCTEIALDGKLHVMSVSVNNGSSMSVFKSYDMKNGVTACEYKFADSWPVAINVLDNGRTALIFNNESVILNEELDIVSRIGHTKPTEVSSCGDLIAIATASELLVFDSEGATLRRESIDDIPKSMCMTEKFVFILIDDRAERYSIYYEEETRSLPVAYDSCKIAALTDNHIVSFGKAGAAMIDY